MSILAHFLTRCYNGVIWKTHFCLDKNLHSEETKQFFFSKKITQFGLMIEVYISAKNEKVADLTFGLKCIESPIRCLFGLKY